MALPQKIYTEEDYYNLPEDVRAELIDGQIYYQAAPNRIHQRILGDLYAAIYTYIKANSGPCEVYPAPFAVKLSADRKNIVEPDISVICDKNKLTDKGCTGAPDWIIEIVSPGNFRHDYIRKLNLYADAGVREYWIIDPGKKKVIVWNFETDDSTEFSFSDSVKAGIYPDFSIDFAGLNI